LAVTVLFALLAIYTNRRASKIWLISAVASSPKIDWLVWRGVEKESASEALIMGVWYAMTKAHFHLTAATYVS